MAVPAVASTTTTTANGKDKYTDQSVHPRNNMEHTAQLGNN